MFSIDFILDYEDGIDSDDILGKIELTAQIESIGEDYTYIDSWFWVLIDGIGTLKKNNSYIGDLIEEPEPLKMYKKGCEIILSYKSDKIILNNIQDLEIAVKKAGQNLINIYRTENNFNNNLFLKKLKNIALLVSRFFLCNNPVKTRLRGSLYGVMFFLLWRKLRHFQPHMSNFRSDVFGLNS